MGVEEKRDCVGAGVRGVWSGDDGGMVGVEVDVSGMVGVEVALVVVGVGDGGENREERMDLSRGEKV